MTSQQRAEEMVSAWFVIDGKEKYLSELETIIAKALDQSRQEGFDEGVSEILKLLSDNTYVLQFYKLKEAIRNLKVKL